MPSIIFPCLITEAYLRAGVQWDEDIESLLLLDVMLRTIMQYLSMDTGQLPPLVPPAWHFTRPASDGGDLHGAEVDDIDDEWMAAD
ncbi:hypothetical protein ACH5RR_036990 [Cinchona calisaya]|uniref:Uncharacterized protein n=1 Tax=Cinchona calisaya TaxID=153742 RepID=A0ABD2Y745_9GENT